MRYTVKTRDHAILSRLIYPVVITLSIAGHLAMSASGLSILASTYTPLAAAALAVTFLERTHPVRAEWQPTRHEVYHDTVFMLAVQMVLPKTAAFLCLLGATYTGLNHGVSAANPWPHDWPAPVQVMLMLLIADFLRYWLHRAAHRRPWLWALHRVHHSPRRLYWLNVGRFHPLDKALQVCLDSLPFILLGVCESVLALYFVFYAVNGFFQHSNIDVKLGPLNYLVSGPELHRWHHARDPRTARCNFGNNLIVWDLLFGTRYLPQSRQVYEIGIEDQHYPTDFAGQIRAPFNRRTVNGAPS